MNPLCGCQFFENCSSRGLFHGVLSFRQGHSSCQKTCSSVGSSSLARAPARTLLQPGLSMSSSLLMPALPALLWLLHRLQCECVTPWSFMGCSGAAFLTMVFSIGLEHVLSSLLADFGVCSVFSCIFLSPLSATAAAHWFLTFLNTVPQRCHQHCWWAQLCAVAGAVLELQQLCRNGGSFCSLLIGTTLTAPCYQNHAL